MATAAETRMNLAALQQRDPYIVSIVDTASQVALYKFNAKTNEWEKTDIEGTLFVYTRSASPINGFMILNRLGLKDLIEPLNKNLEFQLQDPFLLYRNAQGAIHGVWFYDKDECARIGQLMNSLVQVAVQTAEKEGAARQRRASESDTMVDKVLGGVQPKNVDILQMLCRAQNEYDKAKGGGARSEPKPMIDNPNASATKQSSLIKPLALKVSTSTVPDVRGGASGGAEATGGSTTPTTQISLDVLFQRASQQHQQQAVSMADSTNIHTTHSRISKPKSVEHSNVDLADSFSRSRSVAEPTKMEVAGEGSTMPPLLRRLISNPGTTVEEVERQQRGEMPFRDQMTKPAGAEGGRLPPTAHRLHAAPEEPDSPNTTLRKTLNILPPTSHASDLTLNGHSPPAPALCDFSTLMSSLGHQESQPATERTSASRASPPSHPRNSPYKLGVSEVLLTPQAFESCSSPNVSSVPMPSVLQSSAAFPSLIGGGDGHFKADSPLHSPAPLGSDSISPLTREQMQQAILYLIRNDPDFMKTLHEAYVKSLLAQHR